VGQEVTYSCCTGSGQYVPAAGLSLTPLQGTPQKPSEQAGILQVQLDLQHCHLLTQAVADPLHLTHADCERLAETIPTTTSGNAVACAARVAAEAQNS